MSEVTAPGTPSPSAPTQRLAWAGALAASLLSSAVHAQAAGGGEPAGGSELAGGAGTTFQEAIVEYERCHWSRAWELLASAADSGDAQAARLALDMHRFGPELFGRAFGASVARLAAWQASRRRP